MSSRRACNWTSPQVPRDFTLVRTRLKSPTSSASCFISPRPWLTESMLLRTVSKASPRRFSRVPWSFSSTVSRIWSSFFSLPSRISVRRRDCWVPMVSSWALMVVTRVSVDVAMFWPSSWRSVASLSAAVVRARSNWLRMRFWRTSPMARRTPSEMATVRRLDMGGVLSPTETTVRRRCDGVGAPGEKLVPTPRPPHPVGRPWPGPP